MSINWGEVYNTPIGQILEDLSPSTFTSLDTQENQSQLTTLDNQESQDTTQINAWTTLQSDAQAFGSDLVTLANSSTYNQLEASSSANSVATAVDSNAQAGDYTMSVGSLAQSEIDTGTSSNMAVTNPSAIMTLSGGAPLQGSFTIGVGSATPVTVTIPTGGISLNSLVSQINGTSGIGVTASVVQNSSGDYVMEIQANQTGQSISYTDSPPTSGSQTNGPLYYLGMVGTGTAAQGASNVLQAASTAQISLGGSFNSTNAQSSSSNTFTNLVPGLTITAQSLGTTTISVTPNTSAMAQSVQSVVSDWNQWVSDTESLAESGTVTSSGSGANQTFSYSTNSNQELTSGLPVAIINQVQQTLSSYSTGAGGAYETLADIGLQFGANGQITVNSATLQGALESDPSAVQAIFQGIQSTLQPSGQTGVINGFSLGGSSSTGEIIATLTAQEDNTENQVTLLKQNQSSEEEQAILQYGKWVNQVASESQQYSLLTALYDSSNNSSSGG